MNPLQLSILNDSRLADLQRAARRDDLVRAARADHPSPEPLPPLPRGPRLHAPRLRARLRQVRLLLAGSAA